MRAVGERQELARNIDLSINPEGPLPYVVTEPDRPTIAAHPAQMTREGCPRGKCYLRERGEDH